MGIMDMFHNLTGQAPAAAPVMPGQLQTAGVQVQPGNMSPGGVNADGSPKLNADGTPVTASPLDAFNDLWKPSTGQTGDTALFANVDPQKLMEAAKKTNFSSMITKEQSAAIAGGGEGAVTAFAQAMNSVAQTVFAQSALASTKIVDQALAEQQKRFKEMLPNLVKQHTLSDSLRTENPMFNHPSVQPLIGALETSLATKHPNATASELTALAKQYVEGLGQVFNPTVVTDQNTSGAKSDGTDWSKFLE